MAGVLSRIADAIRQPVPATAIEARPMPMRDGVYNPMSGMGLSNDAHGYTRHFHRRLTQFEIDQSYNGSWLMRKLCDKPASDMVRPRRRWKADKPTIALLEAEERRLGVWAKHKQAEKLRGRGGGAIVIWIAGDDPTTPLDPARIRKQGITSLSVWSRWNFRLGEKVFDLGSEWHNQPEYFEITSLNLITQTFGVQQTTTLRLHPSRVVVYRGEDVATGNGCSWEDEFWGASKIEVALAAVLNADTASQAFASMIKDAVNVIIGIPGLTTTYGSLAEIEAYQTARLTAVNAARSIWRAIIKDNGKDGKDGAETVEYRQMNWTGIPEVLMGFVYLVAAAGNMPATVLLGKSPDGMNASGDGDAANWHEELDSRRENEGRPCIEHIDLALIPSALGRVDSGIWWEFGPLSVPSEKDQAQAALWKAQAIKSYIDSGVLNELATEKSVANTVIEDGLLVGYDDALDDVPEDERYPSLTAPDPNETNPSSLQSGNGAKGGDPVLAPPVQPKEAVARRRAVNDALAALGMSDSAIDDVMAMIDAGADE